MGPQPSTKGPVKNRSIFVGSLVIVDLLLAALPLKALPPNLDPVQPVQDFLQKYGVTLSLEWDADIFANIRGGKEQGPVTDGLIQLGLDFDLKTLTRQDIFDASQLHVEGYYPYGTNISSYVMDLAGVNDNAAYNSVRLYELWFQKGFKIGFLESTIRLGLMGADQEFDVINSAAFFINSSFGAQLVYGGNVPVPVYPFTALGARLDVAAGNDWNVKVTFRSAVFDGNSAAPTLGPFAVGAPSSFSYNPHGVDFHLDPSKGLIFIDEFAFDYLSREPQEKNVGGPGRWFLGPGHLVIGGFYSTDRMEDIFQAQLQSLGVIPSGKSVRQLQNDYAGYCILEQKIYEPVLGSAAGLYLFSRGMFLPDDRNYATISVETGVVYKGLFRQAKELRDSFGIGFGYNRISGAVQEADRVAGNAGAKGVPNLRFESLVEATYACPITEHWKLQPDIQWVIRPGAAGSYPNAVVLGLRSIVTF
jgi:porin